MSSPASRTSTSAPSALQRLGRLALKECRESLRDRRTLATLLLMPLIVYPLLGMVVQRFAVTRLETAIPEASVVIHDQLSPDDFARFTEFPFVWQAPAARLPIA